MNEAAGFRLDASEAPSALFDELAAEASELEPEARLLGVLVVPPFVPEPGHGPSRPREAKLVFHWQGLDGTFSGERTLSWMRYRELLRRFEYEEMARRGV